MIIEYAHLYVDDLLSGTVDTVSLKKSVEIAASVAKPGDQLWVLLDDKALNLTASQKQDATENANRLFEAFGLAADQIHFEKTFAAEAEVMISALPQECLSTERFKRQAKSVIFFNQNGIKVPLKTVRDDGIQYSCPLLSSLWRKFKESQCDQTLTILESKYQSVEDNVATLLSAANYPALDTAEYIWF